MYINKVCTTSYHRKFEQEIEITDNKLYLCTWSDIISTLQFEDATLPESTNEDLYINIPNGKYNVTVKELFDYQDEAYSPIGQVSYAVEFHSIERFHYNNQAAIYWTEAFPNDDSIMLDNSANEFDELIEKLIQDSKNS